MCGNQEWPKGWRGWRAWWRRNRADFAIQAFGLVLVFLSIVGMLALLDWLGRGLQW